MIKTLWHNWTHDVLILSLPIKLISGLMARSARPDWWIEACVLCLPLIQPTIISSSIPTSPHSASFFSVSLPPHIYFPFPAFIFICFSFLLLLPHLESFSHRLFILFYSFLPSSFISLFFLHVFVTNFWCSFQIFSFLRGGACTIDDMTALCRL